MNWSRRNKLPLVSCFVELVTFVARFCFVSCKNSQKNSTPLRRMNQHCTCTGVRSGERARWREKERQGLGAVNHLTPLTFTTDSEPAHGDRACGWFFYVPSSHDQFYTDVSEQDLKRGVRCLTQTRPHLAVKAWAALHVAGRLKNQSLCWTTLNAYSEKSRTNLWAACAHFRG